MFYTSENILGTMTSFYNKALGRGRKVRNIFTLRTTSTHGARFVGHGKKVGCSEFNSARLKSNLPSLPKTYC